MKDTEGEREDETERDARNAAMAAFSLEDKESCPVCLLEFKSGDSVSRSRNCWHEFHEGCISEWLNRHDTCPMCRRDFFEAEEKIQQREESPTAASSWFSSRNEIDSDLWIFLF